MIIKKEFTTETDMNQIISSMVEQGATLLEVQNHTDGDFLVFEDYKPEPKTPFELLQDKVQALETRILTLEAKKTEIPTEK
jgi:hypothetical protein